MIVCSIVIIVRDLFSIYYFFYSDRPDYSTLEGDYHGVIVTCLQAYCQAHTSSNGNWLLIGLGGGVLTMKLIRAFPQVYSLLIYLSSTYSFP
jgi:hypothetical protein